MNPADLVLIDTGVWAAFFSKPASREKHEVDILLDYDRVALSLQSRNKIKVRIGSINISLDTASQCGDHEIRQGEFVTFGG